MIRDWKPRRGRRGCRLAGGRWRQTNPAAAARSPIRSEEHTSELQSQSNLVCRLLLEKKKIKNGDDYFEHFTRLLKWIALGSALGVREFDCCVATITCLLSALLPMPLLVDIDSLLCK